MNKNAAMNATTFLPIASEFHSKGFSHRLVKRSGMVALFERNHVKIPGPTPHFEVVVLKNQPAYTIHGADVPAKEAYPSSEQWGTYGFTFKHREHAEAKFIALT